MEMQIAELEMMNAGRRDAPGSVFNKSEVAP